MTSDDDLTRRQQLIEGAIELIVQRLDRLELHCKLVAPVPDRPAPCTTEAAGTPSWVNSDKQPFAPTKRYCMLPDRLVRWTGGTITLSGRLFCLLRDIFEDDGLTVATSPAMCWNGKVPSSSTAYRILKELTGELEKIEWPWTYGLDEFRIVTKTLSGQIIPRATTVRCAT